MYWTFRTGNTKLTPSGVRTPTGIDDMEAWFASDHGVDHTANEVYRWRSKVNQHYVTQSVGSAMPTLMEGVVNGQHTLDFDNGDFLSNDIANNSLVTVFSGGLDHTIVTVSSLNSGAGGNDAMLSWGQIGESIPEATVMNLSSGGYLRLQIGNGATSKAMSSLSNTRDDEYHMHMLSVGGVDIGSNSTWSARTDGNFDGTQLNTNIDQYAPFDLFQIGKRVRTGAEFWWGTISEIMIYDRRLTALETEQVEEYLFAKYFAPENFADTVEWFKPDVGVQT